MDIHARFSTFLMALVTCIGPAPGQSAAPAQEQKPSFTMTIRLKQKTVKPGSEVSVDVDMTNTSSKEVQILLSRRGLTPYTFQVLDGTGKVAPVTPVGRAIVKGDDVVRDEKGNMRLLTGGGSMVPLAPGRTLHDTFVVTGYHDLSQPGEYTIRLQRTDPATKLIVTSNTVTLIVAN